MIRALMRFFGHGTPPPGGRVGRGLGLDHAGLSDTGRVRPANEDRWFADPANKLYLVTDGMGGQLAGDWASRIVAEVLPASVHNALGDVADFKAPATVQRVLAAVRELSRRLRGESERKPGLDGMGATLAMVLVRGTEALVIHLGDSRAYRFRRGKCDRLTKDHTLAQLLVETGAISPEDALAHPARNQLTRFIGMPHEPLPEARLVDLAPGDRLMLCTDGLTSMVPDAVIAEILAAHADPRAACQAVITAANEAGGKDNITAVIMDWSGASQ